MLPVAFAAVSQHNDRADNAFQFSYDATQQDIISASSSLRFTRDDLVQFTVVVKDTDQPPLEGRVTMDLASEKAVRYVGRLTFTVADSGGALLYQANQHVAFTLKPRANARSRTFVYPFDLEGTGDYSVTAAFTPNGS
jgi:hypothetical protein